MEELNQSRKRILVVDDNESIHEDIHNILDSRPQRGRDSETKKLEQELFGDDADSTPNDEMDTANYVIEDAYQGAEAIKMVDQAAAEGFPYAMILMDVRMPPGMDGIQAITEIWKKHPQIEMVICTAYSDYSWDQIIDQFGSTEHLFFMKKPFDSIALKQTAMSLTTKWDAAKRKAKYVQELEAEVKQRTQQVNEMMDHLKQLKKDSETLTIAKNKFVSSITSELQTPLNGILGVTDLLLDTELNDEQRDFAETIKLSGNSLLLVVNDILDFSKAESTESKHESIAFDLRTTLDTVIDLVSVAANDKEIEIVCFVDSRVNQLFVGDPFKLRQILLLSLTHIIQSEESCEIVISVSNYKEQVGDDTELLIEISKLNKINEDFLSHKRIFKNSSFDFISTLKDHGKFPRQDQIEELVQLLNGEFFTDRDLNNGVIIRFSARFGIGGPTFPTVVLSSTIIGMRCLIMSDYSIGRKILSLHIDHWGGISKVASFKENIIEKINLAKESNLPFDAVIIDLKNESLESYQTIAQAILENANKHKVKPPKLICLTANAQRGDAQKIEDFGYNVYLTKPIKQSQLFKSLLLVKSLKDDSQFLDPSTLITKHFVDEFTPDYFKVLVVDESPNNLKMIITCLARLKVRCDIAESKNDIAEVLRKNKYDLILIDCTDCDKADLDQIIDIRKTYSELKTVLMIDRDDLKSQKVHKDGNIDDFIVKPVGSDNLISMLQKNLSS